MSLNVEEDVECQVLHTSTVYTDHNGLRIEHAEKLGEQELMSGTNYDVFSGPEFLTFVRFQCGAVPENGINGLTNESLLAMVIHRTKILDEKFPCAENKQAITHMEMSLAAFESRTKNRQQRGVEGKEVI